MQQIKKLYNIMSFALRKVMDCSSERDFERMRDLEETYRLDITDRLVVRFPDMFIPGTRNVRAVSELQLLFSSLLEDLERYLTEMSDQEELIFLIKYLDLFLEDTVYACILPDEEQYFFECLNDNVSECGICLLPRISCKWEHENREAYISYNILFYLRNFYYVTTEDVKDFRIQHILMPKELFRHAILRREFRVAVSPVVGEKVVEVTEPYVREHGRYVAVKQIKPEVENCLLEHTLDSLKQASVLQADILLFPEMLGTDKIVDALGYELDRRERIEENDFPRLAICPSVWKQNRNSCTILDDMGETVCKQEKHYGVKLKRWDAKEDIVSNHNIYILHCYGIGRVAVAICKDFLMNEYLKILVEKLKVNLLLVPSFTSKDYQFETRISQYGDQDCSVVWINTCSARWLEETGMMRSAVTMAYLCGRKGSRKLKRTVHDLCAGIYEGGQSCLYTYQVRW